MPRFFTFLLAGALRVCYSMHRFNQNTFNPGAYSMWHLAGIDPLWHGMIRFYSAFNGRPEALRRILSLYLASESRDEISPLTTLSRHLPDCALRELVRRHLTDEGRHRRLLQARLDELGWEAWPIPKPLEIQEYWFQKDGSLQDILSLKPGEALEPRKVIEILLFASVLEEFVCSRMAAHAAAAAQGDPRTYFLLMEILSDELRHTAYTQEQAYLLASQTELIAHARQTHLGLRDAMKRFGARHFRLLFEHVLPRDVLGMGRIEYAVWQGIAQVQDRVGTRVVHPLAPADPEALLRLSYPFGAVGATLRSALAARA